MIERAADGFHSESPADDGPTVTRIVNVNAGLRERVVSPGKGDELAAIQRAELALEELSDKFDSWIFEETEKLRSAGNAVRQSGGSENEYELLYCAAHDLKGQAATLGYPLVAEICASLCTLLDNIRDKNRIPAILIDQHIDSVRAMLHESVKDTENSKARKLIHRLSLVTKDYILQEVRRGQESAAA